MTFMNQKASSQCAAHSLLKTKKKYSEDMMSGWNIGKGD
jgi:hypothetical protein